MATPNRPANVPAAARWNETNQQWEQGTYDEARQLNSGDWIIWRKNGKILWESTYNNEGQLHGAYKRYHPNGDVSQEGAYRNGQLHGVITYYKNNNSTDEYFPYSYGDVVKAVFHCRNGSELKTYYYSSRGYRCDRYGSIVHKDMPEAAFPCSSEYYVWEMGDYDDNGAKVGAWERWRYDGYSTPSLIEKSTFNAEGKMHGVRYQYNYDKSIAYQGEYINDVCIGDHVYTRGHGHHNHFSSLPEAIHTKIVHYNSKGEEISTTYKTANGSLCNRFGKAIIEATLDDIWQQTTPETFLSSHAEIVFNRIFGLKKTDSAALDAIKATFQAVYDRPLPDKIALLLDWVNRFDKKDILFYSQMELGGGQFDVLRLWLDTDKNIFEQAIRKAQLEYPFDFLIEWFSNTIALDKFQTSTYSYYDGGACSFLYAPFSDYVHPFVHQSYSSLSAIEFYSPVTSNLSSWLYMMSVLSSYFEWDVTTESKSQDAFEKLHGKVRLASLYYYFFNFYNKYGFITHDDANPEMSDQPTENYLARSRWILELFRAQHNGDSIRDYMFNGSEAHMSFAKMQENMLSDTFDLELQNHIPDALFYMWSGFFCKGGEALLARSVAACLASPVRLIRDAALLVQECINGRTTIGHQREIQTLRHWFEPSQAQA